MKSSWRDFLLVGSVCVLLGVSLMLVLSRMGNEVQEDMEFKCQDLQGELVFYECYHAGDWFLAENDRCVNKVAGYVCKLPDGSEVEFTYDLLAREVKP